MVHWYPKLQPCLAVLKWRTRLEGHEPINLRLFKFQGISILYPLAIQHSKLEAMAHLRMTYLSTMVTFHSYVKLPKGHLQKFGIPLAQSYNLALDDMIIKLWILELPAAFCLEISGYVFVANRIRS